MSETSMRPQLPVGSIGRHASGWFGMQMIVMTEAALFAYLLFSYFYFAVQGRVGFLPDRLPEFRLSGPNTLILIASSLVLRWGEHALRRNEKGKAALGVALTLLLGLAFVGIQILEWREKTFTFNSSPYGSLFFIVTGFHMAHVAAGLLMLATILVWILAGYFDRWRDAPVRVVSLYWHFVDIVWLCVFFSLYVTPYLR